MTTEIKVNLPVPRAFSVKGSAVSAGGELGEVLLREALRQVLPQMSAADQASFLFGVLAEIATNSVMNIGRSQTLLLLGTLGDAVRDMPSSFTPSEKAH